MKKQHNGFRQIYIFDEFDRFISKSYNIEIKDYIRIVENEMSQDDAEKFIDFTLNEKFHLGEEILSNYLRK